ncbi:12773_t:CDS:2 [Racocetra fulgida]|uniref:12773_t:CDS:1 n=1 Tax=Racocetra fulgida TaxID=60492 RepID=A0A9N9A8D0_9GLOM|nr:12773_t:CDS:2 [Racocetra fulgida]
MSKTVETDSENEFQVLTDQDSADPTKNNLEKALNPVVLGQNVTFDIFATVTDDVGDNGSVVVEFFDSDDDSLLSQPFGLPSGIKANSAINGTFSIPVKLSSLPKGFFIQITVLSHTNGGPFKEVACAITS